ncbi:pimeloyl-ACP methyl ester carboxylesterase [Nonomuraea thailandensis]|uniref:Pimeloyl-ACP methyl ester carboxylesterase n=1 Tax=Nonomuraea thailandensis TaxID=1188745 RepID=A0A9X2K468_9ACTN|nr:alpha/beta hydrolase [Nonomuraea thailandensis]MCP2359109.1 pimeloyl-ACP methyl ester carboxylesterase [Nonomuraea thailandensis]
MSTRMTIEVDGRRASYLTAGERGPVVLLLHGTYWSRVWEPVLDRLAAAGLRPVAVDLPGLGRSEGELTAETATVPALAAWVGRFAAAIGEAGPLAVAGHDIGGGIAQHLLAGGVAKVRGLALVNAVTYDSWPVPAVARYRDPAVVAGTTVEDLLAARRQAVTAALARPASEQEVAGYLDPWNDPRVCRSWMALAAAADGRYTLDLVPALRADETPKLLVWGEADTFQEVRHAERFAAEMPNTRLVRIPGAGHIPMENDPEGVASALAAFFSM